MDVMAPDVPSDAATRKRIAKALRLLTGPLPHLAGLAAAVRVQLDASVPTMGVFASGRLLANPAFTARLKDNELIFVLAHELLHLALRTHDRARGSGRLEFNYAHDYIINDILRTELGFAAIPAGGLDMPGARHRSAEEIVLEMRRNAETMPARSRVFEGRAASMRSVLGGGDSDDAGDVLTDAREREMFPQDADAQEKRRRAIEEIAARGAAHDRHRDPQRHASGLAARPADLDRSDLARRAHLHPPLATREHGGRYRAAGAAAHFVDAERGARHVRLDDPDHPGRARRRRRLLR
jgi:hypothetical protein